MPDPVDVKVGYQIKKHRRRMALSRERLGEQIGASAERIRSYETGTCSASAGELMRIASALGTSVRSLFDDISEQEAVNDNRLPSEILTRQGLALLRAFHGIEDPGARSKVLQFVEDVALETKRPGSP